MKLWLIIIFVSLLFAARFAFDIAKLDSRYQSFQTSAFGFGLVAAGALTDLGPSIYNLLVYGNITINSLSHDTDSQYLTSLISPALMLAGSILLAYSLYRIYKHIDLTNQKNAS